MTRCFGDRYLSQEGNSEQNKVDYESTMFHELVSFKKLVEVASEDATCVVVMIEFGASDRATRFESGVNLRR